MVSIQPLLKGTEGSDKLMRISMKTAIDLLYPNKLFLFVILINIKMLQVYYVKLLHR